MARKHRKKKPKKPRNLVTLNMIIRCKGGPMKDRREGRGGAKNHQRAFLAETADAS